MEKKERASRPGFRQLEKNLSMIIACELAVFVLMLICGAAGIFWLKIVLGLILLAASALGCGLLILMQEYRRKRSWWLIASFASIFLCTLVSLIVNYPAPPVV